MSSTTPSTSDPSSTRGRSVGFSDTTQSSSKSPLQRAREKWKDQSVQDTLKSSNIDTSDPRIKSQHIQKWAKEYATQDKTDSTTAPSSTPPISSSRPETTAKTDPLTRARAKWKDKRVQDNLESQGLDVKDPKVKSKLIQRWMQEYAAKDKKASEAASSTTAETSSARESTSQGVKSLDRSEGAALRAARSGGSSSPTSDKDKPQHKPGLSLKNEAKTPWKTSRSSQSYKPPRDKDSGDPSSQASSATSKDVAKAEHEEQTAARREQNQRRGEPRPDVIDTGITVDFDLDAALWELEQTGADTCRIPTGAGESTGMQAYISNVQPSAHHTAQKSDPSAGQSPYRYAHGSLGPPPTVDAGRYALSTQDDHQWRGPPPSRPTANDYRQDFERWSRNFLSNGAPDHLDPARRYWEIYAPPANYNRWDASGRPPNTYEPDSWNGWTAPPHPAGWHGAPSHPPSPWPAHTTATQPSQRTGRYADSSYNSSTGPQLPGTSYNTYDDRPPPFTYAGETDNTHAMPPHPSIQFPQSRVNGTSRPPPAPSQLAQGPMNSMHGQTTAPQPYTHPTGPPPSAPPYWQQQPRPSQHTAPYIPSGPPASSHGGYPIPHSMQTGGNPRHPPLARFGGRLVNAD